MIKLHKRMLLSSTADFLVLRIGLNYSTYSSAKTENITSVSS